MHDRPTFRVGPIAGWFGMRPVSERSSHRSRLRAYPPNVRDAMDPALQPESGGWNTGKRDPLTLRKPVSQMVPMRIGAERPRQRTGERVEPAIAALS